jgi:hypothetical protein
MLLHAFRCVTCQQQQHSFIRSHNIRHRGESVVARLQVSPVNSNSIHSYAATTSGTEVRVLLHAFRCVTCQQQQHLFMHTTTSGTEVRVLLHAFRCVTCQQQQHLFMHTTTSGTQVRVLLHAFRCVTYHHQKHSFIQRNHIRHRGNSVQVHTWQQRNHSFISVTGWL